jgi:hypothetical protein
MTKEHTRQSGKGELRRRWRALLEDGSMASLRSEGRLVAIYVLQVADWTSCEAVFSIRRAAGAMSVRKNTVCRGISQLVKADVVEIVSKGRQSKPSKYRVCKRPRTVDQAPTGGGQGGTPTVYQAPTAGVPSAHDSWARRLQAVGASTTGGGRHSVFFSGSPVRTSENTSEATPGGGVGPPPARPEDGGQK